MSQDAETPEEEEDVWQTKEEEDPDEVLLREIEEEEAREAAIREAAMAEALAKGLGPDGKAQLTPFIEQIITTGSGVSKALLIVLVIAFIVKCFEHMVNYIKRKRALSKITSAISK